MENKKAYLINYNTFYLDLFEFKSHQDFSSYMYEFVNTYAREAYDYTTKYEVWCLYMHNYTLNTSAIFIHPYMEKNIGFSAIYKKSIKDETRFLIVQIEFYGGREHYNGSLLDIKKYKYEN